MDRCMTKMRETKIFCSTGNVLAEFGRNSQWNWPNVRDWILYPISPGTWGNWGTRGTRGNWGI